jgi:hypothetical protein
VKLGSFIASLGSVIFGNVRRGKLTAMVGNLIVGKWNDRCGYVSLGKDIAGKCSAMVGSLGFGKWKAK